MDPGTHNPYQAPDADADADAGSSYRHTSASQRPLVLAPRGTRLGASFIDGVLALGILLPIQYAAGVFEGLAQGAKQTPLQTVLWSMGGLVLFVLLHGYFLKQNGQTIGKRLLRIRIASVEDGSTPPLDRLLLWRVLPTQLVVLVPYVGPLAMLVDAFFIFRPDHRCVHDHLARTIVVRAD